jgi:NADH:ubiquinone oxidoreductase subunit E
MPTLTQYNIKEEYLKFLNEEGLQDKKEKVDEILAKFRGQGGGLIPVLQQVQETIGYLPAVVQDYIALGLGVPSCNVFGVVSFYSFFSMTPKGKHVIKVCLGTACYVKGANKIIENIERGLNIKLGETTEDKNFTLEGVRCLGACGLAPVVVVGEDTLGLVDPTKVMKLLENYK